MREPDTPRRVSGSFLSRETLFGREELRHVEDEGERAVA